MILWIRKQKEGGFMDIKELETKLAQVKEAIEEAEKELAEIEVVDRDIKGYLVFKYIRCGKPACRCMKGGSPHGPYPHLQWWEDGKIKTKYVNKKMFGRVASDLDKAKRIKQIIKRLKELHAYRRKLEKSIEKIRKKDLKLE